MDIFEYLPQLIVAYDSDDEFANLIHVKKANRDNDYYCPCCGGIVKPRALDSNKEQSHYWHKTGKCTKESQLHFFCKNWLFEKGSKFYIEDELFEVSSIEIEQSHYTPFGDYRPDVTVYTSSGKIIYFEIFFTNRKTGDDYFCKWETLGNDVIEVNIREYMFKTDTTTIPSFTYLYHNGVCYSKPYIKRDLYANTIARIKHELTRQKVLNYKARIEQLDWFWQEIRNNSKESILEIVSKMEYEDMISCYKIIKRKQCVLYLKDDILNIINQKVISDIKDSLNFPKDENVYFDLKHVRGRTYEAGIRLKLKTEHIIYDKLFSSYDNHWHNFDKLKGFPKIISHKNILSIDELSISEKEKIDLQKIYNRVLDYKEEVFEYEKKLCEFEKDIYKIRIKNDLCTVLLNENGHYKLLFEDYPVKCFDLNNLKYQIENALLNRENKFFLEELFKSNIYYSFMTFINNYSDINVEICTCTDWCHKSHIEFNVYIFNRLFSKKYLKNTVESFIEEKSECETMIQNFFKSYSLLLNLVKEINNCKNNFWKAELSLDNFRSQVIIKIDQKIFLPKRYLTFENIYFDTRNCYLKDKNDFIKDLELGMRKVLKNMQLCGYRVMEAKV